MKKIIPIILFFIAAGVAWYLSYTSKQKLEKFDQAKTNQNTEQTKDSKKGVSSTIFSKSGSIMDILNVKESLRCTYTKQGTNYSIEGTLYTDGTNVRTNSKLSSGAKTTDTNSIILGDYIYIWDVGISSGIKMNLQKIKSNLSESTPSKDLDKSNVSTNPLTENFDYTCNPWVTNTEMFKAPDNVTFSDLTEAMEEIKSNPCLLCDTLTDDKKVQCKQSYKCN